MLHRDIKPSNIAITPAGRVVLLDFGLASAGAEARTTTYGTAVGSVLYMAPEQIDGRIDEIDGRTDVYSLGVTLYELLTLQVPSSGKTAEAVRAAIREGAAAPIRVRNPRVSRDLEIVCLKASAGGATRRCRTSRSTSSACSSASRSRRGRRPPLRARLQERMAESFRGLGLYEDALPLAERALAVRRVLHEPDDVRTDDALALSGSIRRLAGLTDQGVAEFEEAREIYACARGPSHKGTLLAQLQIANAYSNFNAYDSALPLIYDAWAALELARLRAESSDGNSERSRTVDFLISAMPMTDWRSRRALLEEGTELARRAFGEQNPRYAEQLAMLGSLRGTLGELEAALLDLDTAGTILASELGAEHPMSMCAARSATDVELRLGRGTLARERLERSAEAVRARLGDNHPRPLFAWLSAAQMAAHVGSLSECTEQLEALASGARFTPVDRAAIRLRALSLLAFERLERGDTAGARRELARIGNDLCEHGADYDLFVALELEFESGDHQRARELIAQALGRPDSRMYDVWRRVMLAFQQEIAQQARTPSADARVRLENAAAHLRTAIGSESALFQRTRRHALAVLRRIESAKPDPAR